MIKFKMIFKICFIVCRLWKKRIYSIFGTKVKRMLFYIGIIFFLVFSISSSYILTSELVRLFIKGDARQLYVLFTSIMITTTFMSFALSILWYYIIPKNNTLYHIIKHLPISEHIATIGYYIPYYAILWGTIVGYIFALYIPTMIIEKIQSLMIIRFILGIQAQAFIAILFVNSLFRVSKWILYILNIGYQRGLQSIIVVIPIMLYLTHYTGMYPVILSQYDKFYYKFPNLFAWIYLINNDDINVDINYGCIVIYLFILMLFFAIAILCKGNPIETGDLMFFKNLKFSNFKFLNLVIKELKIVYRKEDTVLLTLLYFIIILLGRYGYKLSFDNPLMKYVIPMQASLVALESYSNDYNMITIYKDIGISKYAYFNSKLIGTSLWGLANIGISMLIFAGDAISLNAILSILKVFLVGNLSVLVYGCFLPNTKENPYSRPISVMGFFILAPMLIMGSWKLYQFNHIVLQLIICSFIFLLYYLGLYKYENQ